MKLWAYVFPNGSVPIKGANKYTAQIQKLGTTSVYFVDWSRLTEEEQKLIVESMMKKFNEPKEKVLAEILKNGGLPLRASLVGAVSIPTKYFY